MEAHMHDPWRGRTYRQEKIRKAVSMLSVSRCVLYYLRL